MTKAFISEILAMEAHGRVPEVTKKTENFQKNTLGSPLSKFLAILTLRVIPNTFSPFGKKSLWGCPLKYKAFSDCKPSRSDKMVYSYWNSSYK